MREKIPKGSSDLSHNERHLIKEVRSLDFGEITIYVKQGEPHRIERKIESIILGSFEEPNT